MTYLDGNPQIGRMNPQGTAPVKFGDERAMYVEFSTELILQEFESERQGKPVYKEVTYVKMFAPGSKSDVYRPAKLQRVNELDGMPSDPERFPSQWQAFQNKIEQIGDGMPLEMWAPMPKGAVFAFKAMRVMTVENLAALSDGNATNAPIDWRSWREKAQNWLKQAETNQPLAELQAERDSLRCDVEMLKKQIADLATQRKTEREAETS